MDEKEKMSNAPENGGMTLSMSDPKKRFRPASNDELVFGGTDSNAPSPEPEAVPAAEAPAEETPDLAVPEYAEPEAPDNEIAEEPDAEPAEEAEFDEPEDEEPKAEEYDEPADEDDEEEYDDDEAEPEDDEYEDEAEDDEEEEEVKAPIPIRDQAPKVRPSKKQLPKKVGVGVTDFTEEDEDAPVRRKKRKKKIIKVKGSRINNSIFGALILVTIILTVSLFVAISGVSLGMEYIGVGKNEEEITFNIPENATLDDICDLLVYNDLISNKRLFKAVMKLKKNPTLYPGDITLHASMGYARIINELSSKRESYETVTITFKEGITLLEAAQLVEENKVCSADEFIFEFNKKQDFAFESDVDMTADTYYKMEGFFFPDTYDFYVNDSAYNAVRTIKANFQAKYDDFRSKLAGSGLTLSQAVTLASVVEWEAVSAEDMPLVASVFINRLNNSDEYPKLQSDATRRYLTSVINVVGDTATQEHYEELYDTYICIGLPVGPVCNPGMDAINAVLEPADTNYYFFCNDIQTGEGYFAETYEEHQANLIRAGLST